MFKVNTGRFTNESLRQFANVECQFIPVTSGPNVQNTFSFGSAVDERTRNKLYGVSSGYVYLAVCLTPQWIKERGIIEMRVWAKVTLYSVV